VERRNREVGGMKALGIDPGTSSFDFCVLDDQANVAVYEASVPTAVVATSPESLLSVVKEADADVIVGPSAMGLPVTQISYLTDLKLAQATLGKNTEVDIAIRQFIMMQKELNLNVFFTPNVIQLPTVPLHRKRNKIDMGTADKTCIAALALRDYANSHSENYQDANVVVLELGFGFNAIMAIEAGQLIDGIGGTIFPGPGYLTIGAMDLEIAHTLGGFTEAQLGFGGIAYAAGDVIPPEEYVKRLDEANLATAWNSLVEGIVKAVAMELTVFEAKPTEIILSGRLTRVPKLYSRLVASLERYDIPIRKLEGYATKSKEAAQGAALIASGLAAGGTHADLVDVLELRGASGTVLDYVRWPGFNAEATIRKKLQAMKMAL
jgi:predicted butyrate kinase (DUF1464 family)